MEKITSLTAEQKAKFPQYIEEWTDIGLSTDPADRPRAEAAIVKMYEIAGKKAPKIVWCGSPLSQGLTRHAIMNLPASVRASVGASRITLEIIAVRVERLKNISATDAQAEGIVPAGDGGWYLADTRHYMGDPVSSYASLWESINGPDSWDLNPWVWVIEFKVVKS